eukprot:6134366-Alexandrium_andersonii.AAC.1
MARPRAAGGAGDELEAFLADFFDARVAVDEIGARGPADACGDPAPLRADRPVRGCLLYTSDAADDM